MKKEIYLLGILQKTIISHSNNKNTYITYLTKEEYKELDKNEIITIKRKDKEILLNSNNVIIYGEFNLSNEDLETIERLNLRLPHSIIHTNIDYLTGVCTFEDTPKFKDTIDSVEWFIYNYLLIGNPNYIVIYNETKKRI